MDNLHKRAERNKRMFEDPDCQITTTELIRYCAYWAVFEYSDVAMRKLQDRRNRYARKLNNLDTIYKFRKSIKDL